MKSLKYYNTLNSLTNELTKPASSIRFCLAIYLEDNRNDILLRHDHAREASVSSLGSLEGESRVFYFGGLDK